MPRKKHTAVRHPDIELGVKRVTDGSIEKLTDARGEPFTRSERIKLMAGDRKVFGKGIEELFDKAIRELKKIPKEKMERRKLIYEGLLGEVESKLKIGDSDRFLAHEMMVQTDLGSMVKAIAQGSDINLDTVDTQAVDKAVGTARDMYYGTNKTKDEALTKSLEVLMADEGVSKQFDGEWEVAAHLSPKDRARFLMAVMHKDDYLIHQLIQQRDENKEMTKDQLQSMLDNFGLTEKDFSKKELEELGVTIHMGKNKEILLDMAKILIMADLDPHKLLELPKEEKRTAVLSIFSHEALDPLKVLQKLPSVARGLALRSLEGISKNAKEGDKEAKDMHRSSLMLHSLNIHNPREREALAEIVALADDSAEWDKELSASIIKRHGLEKEAEFNRYMVNLRDIVDQPAHFNRFLELAWDLDDKDKVGEIGFDASNPDHKKAFMKIRGELLKIKLGSGGLKDNNAEAVEKRVLTEMGLLEEVTKRRKKKEKSEKRVKERWKNIYA
ncbi:MAG: hypothetical protein KAW41_06220 [Candidatus Diapherotrites archaeon]|nr:hypothetical protein [Candidatus Diapherotrites archaeon]